MEPLSSAVDKISSFGEYRLEFTIPEELAENLLHQLTLLPALSIAGVKYVMQHRYFTVLMNFIAPTSYYKPLALITIKITMLSL